MENSILPSGIRCKACDSQDLRILCTIPNVPVHSVKLERSRQSALDFPRGDIQLGFCESCGFIFNVAYDPDLHNYLSNRYDSTQAWSPTFNEFHRHLASSLVERFDLRGKTIIEIGCGQGEFLTLLCELGSNKGIGFDPAYIKLKPGQQVNGKLTFIKDYYSEKYAHYSTDFICCKMTLEHIHNPKEFVSMVRRSIGNQLDTVVFFQVPDVTRILRDIAFWDIYYEHCSYFSPESFLTLFQNCGFDIISVNTEYDDQYLMIEAIPRKKVDKTATDRKEDLTTLKRDVDFFSNNFLDRLNYWREKIRAHKREGSRPVIWGGGSKGVAYLTTLGIIDGIEYAVDINPRKSGTYLAGSGQMVVSPEFLQEYKPGIVLLMNKIYLEEIRTILDGLGVQTELSPVG